MLPEERCGKTGYIEPFAFIKGYNEYLAQFLPHSTLGDKVLGKDKYRFLTRFCHEQGNTHEDAAVTIKEVKPKPTKSFFATLESVPVSYPCEADRGPNSFLKMATSCKFPNIFAISHLWFHIHRIATLLLVLKY